MSVQLPGVGMKAVPVRQVEPDVGITASPAMLAQPVMPDK